MFLYSLYDHTDSGFASCNNVFLYGSLHLLADSSIPVIIHGSTNLLLPEILITFSGAIMIHS